MNELYKKAQELDANDPAAAYRKRFSVPERDGNEVAYLCGNSLGLAPVQARALMLEELTKWESAGVEGHFSGERPWLSFHEGLAAPLAQLVGAQPDEVVCTNTLTANLHALLASFYRPTPDRPAILIESDAFPSDRYAARSWITTRGHEPNEDLLIAEPEAGELLCDALLRVLRANQGRIALVFVGGVHYLTGEFLDLATLTEAAHDAGALLVTDLAHAAGNVSLSLHDWGVDAAAWCSYKYLNSGPGAAAGLFVHQDHFDAFRLAGWWGNAPEKRFEMPEVFVPQSGAGGWQWSNAPVFSMAPVHASLEIFSELPAAIRETKRDRLFHFAVDAVEQELTGLAEIVTPTEPDRHGSQLSLKIRKDANAVEELLAERGVIIDSRPPDIVRIAPTPLYNRYTDIVRFVDEARDILAGP